jgi:hypothetical protein
MNSLLTKVIIWSLQIIYVYNSGMTAMSDSLFVSAAPSG